MLSTFFPSTFFEQEQQILLSFRALKGYCNQKKWSVLLIYSVVFGPIDFHCMDMSSGKNLLLCSAEERKVSNILGKLGDLF